MSRKTTDWRRIFTQAKTRENAARCIPNNAKDRKRDLMQTQLAKVYGR